MLKGRQQHTHEQTPEQRLNVRVDNWKQRVESEIFARERAMLAKKINKVGRREAEFLVWSMWDESHLDTRKLVLKMLGLDLPTTKKYGTTFRDADKPLRQYIAGLKAIPAVLALAVTIATAPCVGAGRWEGQ